MPHSQARAEAMKKPSRAGGKPAKAKALKPKGRSAPKAMPRRGSAPAGQDTEVARLARERDEAVEQQTATANVLRVISSHRPISSLSSTLSCERPANYVPQNMLSYLGCGMDSTMSRAPTTPKQRSLNISQSTRSMLTEGRWLAAQRLSAVRSISPTV